MSGLDLSTDLNDVTSTAISVSGLLNRYKQSIKDSDQQHIIATVIDSTSRLKSTTVETIEQLINSVDSISKVSPKMVPDTSRKMLLESMSRSVTDAESFANEGISLADSSHDQILGVLISNINFKTQSVNADNDDENASSPQRKRRSSPQEGGADENYKLLQRMYNMTLKTMIVNENRTLSETSGTAFAYLQRRSSTNVANEGIYCF